MKGTSKDDLFTEAKYDRQLFGIINRYYILHLTWSVLITVMCNICIKVITVSPGTVQTILRNQVRKTISQNKFVPLKHKHENITHKIQ
jgi:hypothetical protein